MDRQLSPLRIRVVLVGTELNGVGELVAGNGRVLSRTAPHPFAKHGQAIARAVELANENAWPLVEHAAQGAAYKLTRDLIRACKAATAHDGSEHGLTLQLACSAALSNTESERRQAARAVVMAWCAARSGGSR